MDQIIRALYDFTQTRIYPAPNPDRGRADGADRRRRLRPRRARALIPTSISCSCCPTRRRRISSRWWNTCSTRCGIWASRWGRRRARSTSASPAAKADLTTRTAILEARYIWGEQKLYDDLKKAFEAKIAKGSASEFVRGQTRRAQRAPSQARRFALSGRAQRQGRQGRLARSPHPVLDRQIHLPRRRRRELGRPQGAVGQGGATLRARAGFPLDGALPSAFPLGPGRGPPDLRIPGRNRAAHGLHRPCRHARRRTLHEALFPHRQGRRRSDAHLLRAAGIRADQGAAAHAGGAGARARRSSTASRSMPAASTSTRTAPSATIRSISSACSIVAEEHGLDIHPHALRVITQSLKLIDNDLRANPEANRLFMEILTSRKDPEVALRRMNEAGVFGRFVPDFGRVVAQMQFDMYHIYTVDEHTLFAIGMLAKIEKGELKDELPLATSLVADDLLAPRALSRRAAARYRQGPRRRPFDPGRRDRVEARAPPRIDRGRNRDHRLAGALASADERHRLQARHRRSADHPRTSSSACNRPNASSCCWC